MEDDIIYIHSYYVLREIDKYSSFLFFTSKENKEQEGRNKLIKRVRLYI